MTRPLRQCNLTRNPSSFELSLSLSLSLSRSEPQRSLDADSPEETPIHVSAVTSTEEASFCESVEAGHSNQDESAQVAQLLNIKVPPVRMDSQCKYGVWAWAHQKWGARVHEWRRTAELNSRPAHRVLSALPPACPFRPLPRPLLRPLPAPAPAPVPPAGAISRGDAAIYLRLPTIKGYEENIWDHASGWLLVREAGGVVTDAKGAPLDFSIGRTLKNNSGVIATNGPVHAAVLAAVKQVLKY